MEIRIHDQVYHIRQAETEDTESVLGLLVQAAEWLQSKGTKQWDYYLSNLEENTPEVVDSITNGSTYLLEKDGNTIATLTLEDAPSEWDRDIWEQEVEDEGVTYLHRIVVNREYAGQNFGGALIEWARKQAKARDRKYIRFDCLGTNEGLNRYYQRKYKMKGIANVYGEHCKYEIVV